MPTTLIFYESPKRLAALLAEMAAQLGDTREAAVCRELTKRFEEVRRGTLADLAAHYAGAPPKGEIVVVVDRARGRAAGSAPYTSPRRTGVASRLRRRARYTDRAAWAKGGGMPHSPRNDTISPTATGLGRA